MKVHLASFLLLVALASCTSSQEQCSDCDLVPPQLAIKPVGGGYKGGYISVGNSVQWEAELLTRPTPTPFPADRVSWSATRGTISDTGLFKAPSTPTLPNYLIDDINAVRKDVPNPSGVDRAGSAIFIVALPVLQSFISPTPIPVAPGAAVILTSQFTDGIGELYTGSTLVQSGLQSGGSVTVHPTVTTIFTLKVTNQAGDSVSGDLTITVQ